MTNNKIQMTNKGWMRKGLLVLVGVLCAWGGRGYAEEIEQEKCPVMTENDVDPEIFTEYEGVKVYFCCTFCRAAFEKEPEKYLANLPPFASTMTGKTQVKGKEPSEGTERRLWNKNIILVGVVILIGGVIVVGGALQRRKSQSQ